MVHVLEVLIHDVICLNFSVI